MQSFQDNGSDADVSSVTFTAIARVFYYACVNVSVVASVDVGVTVGFVSVTVARVRVNVVAVVRVGVSSGVTFTAVDHSCVTVSIEQTLRKSEIQGLDSAPNCNKTKSRGFRHCSPGKVDWN